MSPVRAPPPDPLPQSDPLREAQLTQIQGTTTLLPRLRTTDLPLTVLLVTTDPQPAHPTPHALLPTTILHPATAVPATPLRRTTADPATQLRQVADPRIAALRAAVRPAADPLTAAHPAHLIAALLPVHLTAEAGDNSIHNSELRI